jgi:hypothetical protein
MLDENTLPWLSRMEACKKEKVLVELEKQDRARENLKKGRLTRRTARRIIERSQKRIAWIAMGL